MSTAGRTRATRPLDMGQHRQLLDGGASPRSESHVFNGEGEPAMSHARGRREAHGEQGGGMSRRRLLELGVLSATAPSVLLRPRRAAAQIGGAQPTAPTPAGELKNPVEFKGPEGKGRRPTPLSFLPSVRF